MQHAVKMENSGYGDLCVNYGCWIRLLINAVNNEKIMFGKSEYSKLTSPHVHLAFCLFLSSSLFRDTFIFFV